MTTKISWVKNPDGFPGRTWDVTGGCTKCSPGCLNCWAIDNVYRLSCNPNPKVNQPNHGLTFKRNGVTNWTGRVVIYPDRLDIPLKTRKSTTFFVCSKSDLFHKDVPMSFISSVFCAMGARPQHTFIVLTKRPTRMQDYIQGVVDGLASKIGLWTDREYGCHSFPLPNIWLGVTVCNQQEADEKIPILLQIPAAVRFVSIEPMLGPVDLDTEQAGGLHALGCGNPGCDCGNRGLDWVILGGESGPGARPMHPDWARAVRDQCQAAGVPFFFKQWGQFVPGEATEMLHRGNDKVPGWCIFQNKSFSPSYDVILDEKTTAMKVGKKEAGNLLDGLVWEQMPEVMG